MIRSTKHSLKYANSKKKSDVIRFLSNYRAALQEYVDFIWYNPIIQNNKLILDIQNNKLNSISYIDYNCISLSTKLSARSLSSAATQACGIVSGVIRRKSKYLYIANKLLEENDMFGFNRIKQKLDKIKINKPIIGNNVKAELSSKLIDFQFDKTSFDCFIRLKSLGDDYSHIKLPIKLTEQDHKWNNGKLLGSILLSENTVDFRYDSKTPELKTQGITVGADTGVNAIITLSDRQSPKITDIHGYSFSSILEKLARKKRGSKAFGRTQDHRKNFINWSINQLNLSDIKQVNLEHVSNLFYKHNTSAKLKRFTNSLIEEKITRYLEEAGVQLVLKSSAYKSQRCSNCGMVHYLNRKGKLFKCRSCGYVEDADYNSAINNSFELPRIPEWVVSQKLNRKSGFYWKLNGLFDKDGQEFRVPDSQIK